MSSASSRRLLPRTAAAPVSSFGFAVAVSDDGQTIAVSAPFEPGAGLGSVHVFRGSGSQWTPVAHLQAPEGVDAAKASLLNISEGTSKWHLSEARKFLIQKLQQVHLS